MGKVRALKTLYSKLTQRQRDLRNARSRVISASRRASRVGGDKNRLTRKEHVSKRMKELIKQGKMDDIVKEAKKGTGYYAGKSKPGSGVGRWEYK
jgi:hypothetical protein